MKVSLMLTLISAFFLCTILLSGVSAQNSNLTSVSSPTSKNLNCVYVINNFGADNNDLTALDAWAVGDGGTIIHWDGSNWTMQTSPTTNNLYGVAFVNSSSGWAVGGTSSKADILYYNGTEWSVWKYISFKADPNDTDVVNATLYSISVTGDGLGGWIVGANGTTLGWCDNAWYNIASPTTNVLRSVAMVHGSDNAWTVGEGGVIMMWNGNSWQMMTSPTSTDLLAIQLVNSTNGWAGGGKGDNGVLLYLNGTNWTNWNRINLGGSVNSTTGYVTDSLNKPVNSIAMDTGTSAWAAGGNGTVLYWTGTEWDGQLGIAGGTNLRSVSMVHGTSNGSTQAWAVGDNGKIIAWTGAQWVPEVPIIMLAPLLLSIGLLVLFSKARLRRIGL